MLRFILRREYKSSVNALETTDYFTIDVDVPDVEDALVGGGSCESGYDYRRLVGVEIIEHLST